jgi:hypothetical protein
MAHWFERRAQLRRAEPAVARLGYALLFFFEKKNQKTFARFGFGFTSPTCARRTSRNSFALHGDERNDAHFLGWNGLLSITVES